MRKKEEIWLSPERDKSPYNYTNRKSKKGKWQHKNGTKT